jgi:hypothetical protein
VPKTVKYVLLRSQEYRSRVQSGSMAAWSGTLLTAAGEEYMSECGLPLGSISVGQLGLGVAVEVTSGPYIQK